MVLDKFKQFILRRRQAYRSLFLISDGELNIAAKIVLTDLRTFCRATSTPAVVSPISQTIDPIATGVLIGRLEVWHRITQNLHLSDADLYRLVEDKDGTE